MKKLYFTAIRLFFTIITTLSIQAVLAQGSDSAYNNMQFHYGSPEAGSSGKNTSVDLFRGTLNVNVPLHNYKGRQYDLPMSLGYNADGVQVEELASNVGLGWNLGFGGRMTSIVNGMPDGQTITGGTAQQCGFEYSTEHAVRDKYVMDVPGGGQEIFFMDYYVAKCITNPLITVEPHLSSTDDWIVKMPDGTKYYFGENNKYETSTTYAAAEGTCPATERIAVSSWLLTKIVSADGLDTYRFEYATFDMTQAIPNNGEGIASYGGPNAFTRIAESSYKLKQQMVTKVFHNDALIIEMTYKGRDDLKVSSASYPGNALEAILFYNYAPAQPLGGPYTVTPYKKIVFNHSYYGMQAASTNTDFTKKRLKLDGITVVGIDGNDTENGDEYVFHYIDSPDGATDFPDIASYAQDYAGLYNGKNQNPHLIPTVNGNQRDFSLGYALTGTLDKITYPGKGYSVFEYEQNRNDGSYEIVETPYPQTHDIPGTLADGFRIRKISNYTGSAVVPATVAEYRYGQSAFASEVKNAFAATGGYQYRSSQGYTTGTTVLCYNEAYEFQSDGNGANNGYIKYNFLHDFEYYMNCTRNTYELTAPSGSGMVAGVWDFDFNSQKVFDGRAFDTRTYNKNGKLMSSVTDNYDRFQYSIGDVDGDGTTDYETYKFLSSNETVAYFDGVPMATTVNYSYAGNFLCESALTTGPDGLSTQEFYMYDVVLSNGSDAIKLLGSYDVAQTFYTNKTYATINNRAVVTELASGKNQGVVETKLKYEYDSDGNMVTKIAFTPGTLTPTSYESTIYGYSDRIPIVQVSGLKYSDLDPTIVTAIKNASNLPVTTANTNTLLNAQKALRDWLRTYHPMARATCSTFNPVFGITSTTGMTEHTILFEYDILGRQILTKKKDVTSNIAYIASEKRYHIRVNSSEQNWMKEIVYKIPVTTPIENPTIAEATVSLVYLDGLGRTVQKTTGKQSLDQQTGTYSDISAFTEYDAFGRSPKSYLPYATGTDNFRFDETNSETLSFPEYANNNPYFEKEFDGSPLNRIVKSSSPGNQANWAMGSGHEVQYEYGYNAVNVVRDLSYQNGSVTDDGFHSPETLFRLKTTDEDGNVSEIYKNSKGLMVMQRRLLDKRNDTYLETYYCYDASDNLVLVVPPKVEGSVISSTILGNLCYQYTYDDYNRVIEKKLPEKQSEFLIYDKLNRVVMAGPAYDPMGAYTANNIDRGWLMTFYDDLGRVAYTGWRKDNTIDSNRSAFLQNAYNNTGVENVKRVTTANMIDGIAVQYTDLSNNDLTLLTVNYYDDYDFPRDDINFGFNPNVYFNNTSGTKPLGLPTGSYVRALIQGTSVGETSYILYDKWARSLIVSKKNYLDGVTTTTNELDFAGVISNNITTHQRDSGVTAITAKNIFTYYSNGAIDKHLHEVSEGLSTGNTQILSETRYSKLGRVSGKIIGPALQDVNYSYNIRGWLTGINDVNDFSGNSLFCFKINYDTVDDLILDGTAPKFNGSIAETLWKGSDNLTRRYGYMYDPLNRLTQAVYNKVGGTIPTNSYNEYLWYDSNGNILYTERNGNQDQVGATNQIDELSYRYKSNSNLLENVYDHTASTVGFRDNANATENDTDYVYDLNGNLISDANKGISEIYYNHLNQPVEIKIADRKIYYTYDATGNKLRKIIEDATITTTDYLNGFQYQDEKLKFFPTAEGYVSCTATSNGYVFNYVYNYTDHLGNIRMSYGLEKGVIKILEESHYYPYGLKHTNYNSSLKEWGNKETQPDEVILKAPPVDPGGTVEQIFKYKFNAQEWQNEFGLNVYDMAFRDYDPAIGRWINIDPVTHHSQSTYNAFDGNPVSIADPSGADGVVYGMSGQGAWANPYSRGHQTFLGNPRNLNAGKDRGNYDGSGGGSSESMVFWGSEAMMFEQSWEGHNGIQTTNDPDEISSILSYYSRQSGGRTVQWWGSLDTNGNYEVNHKSYLTKGGSDRISRGMWAETYLGLKDYMSNNRASLRTKFDNMEVAGGTAEIAGLLLAPFTEGASLIEASNGAIVAAGGTFGNIAMDIMVDKKPDVAFGRFVQYIVFKGMGGVANKIPGYYSKLVNATTTFMDTYIMPIFKDNYKKTQP